VLPVNPYGDWNESMLADEDLMNDINLHFQELRKEITAQKLVEYLARDDVREKHGITKAISERTAQRYLKALGYRWTTQWKEIESRMRNWTTENLPEFGPSAPGRRVIVWFHDETIFCEAVQKGRGCFPYDRGLRFG